MACLFKRGKMYWIAYRARGERVSKSLKTKDKAVANYRKKIIEIQILHGDTPVPNLRYIQSKIQEMNWINKRWKDLNSKERQAIIFCLYEGKCFYCGKDISLPTKIPQRESRKIRMVMDHVVPFSNGGSDLPENIVASCNECNLKKHDRDYRQFRKPVVKFAGNNENIEEQIGTPRNN